MFYKRNDNAVISENKVVYIFKFSLGWKDDIFKVGITSREEINARYSEVINAYFTKFRYIPNSSIRRFSKCDNAEFIEQYLLNSFESVQFQQKFNGYSEFIYADEDKLVALYDIIVKNKGEL